MSCSKKKEDIKLRNVNLQNLILQLGQNMDIKYEQEKKQWNNQLIEISKYKQEQILQQKKLVTQSNMKLMETRKNEQIERETQNVDREIEILLREQEQLQNEYDHKWKMFLINEVQNEMIMKMIVDQEKLYEQYANYKIVE